MTDDEREKAELERWRNCKCGGQFKLILDKVGVAHTKPTCDDYEKMDIEVLLSTPGALAHYIFGMEKKKATA